MDEPLSAVAGALGEEGLQLLVIDLLRLRHYLLAQMRGLEIGSKLDFIHSQKVKEQSKLRSPSRECEAYSAHGLS